MPVFIKVSNFGVGKDDWIEMSNVSTIDEIGEDGLKSTIMWRLVEKRESQGNNMIPLVKNDLPHMFTEEDINYY